MARKILITGLIFFALIYAIFLYWGRVKPIEPALQKEVNANIPECAESELLAKKLRELNRDYYYENEMNDFQKASKECLSKMSVYLNEKQNNAKHQ